jgi:hypothetical protein
MLSQRIGARTNIPIRHRCLYVAADRTDHRKNPPARTDRGTESINGPAMMPKYFHSHMYEPLELMVERMAAVAFLVSEGRLLRVVLVKAEKPEKSSGGLTVMFIPKSP